VKEGLKQLEIYLTMSDAKIGVWFNGKEHLYLRKDYVKGGEIRFQPLPNLPRFGQRVEDIGLWMIVQDSFDIHPTLTTGLVTGTIISNDQILCGNVASPIEQSCPKFPPLSRFVRTRIYEVTILRAQLPTN
jgi:hypothetical protein